MGKSLLEAHPNTKECCYCSLIDRQVEAGGVWYCPNVCCAGPGAAFFRGKLSSFKPDGERHTVDPEEWAAYGILEVFKMEGGPVRDATMKSARQLLAGGEVAARIAELEAALDRKALRIAELEARINDLKCELSDSANVALDLEEARSALGFYANTGNYQDGAPVLGRDDGADGWHDMGRTARKALAGGEGE